MTTTFKDSDPATDHLLDFIAGGVPTNTSGESAGNYDATFGCIDGSTYGELAEKTLSQIYAMQDDMLAENDISTATGRYQGLRSTIQEYQQRTGLPSSTLFDHRLQDDFGLTKMVDRGYQSWWAGSLSDDELMHRLSCEWASLPDPYNDGKSHYDGDEAGNHASTTLDHFRAAVTQARACIESEQPPPQPEPPLIGILDDTDRAIRMIQRVLVLTGDLIGGRSDIDGDWGPRSQAALDNLITRDT